MRLRRTGSRRTKAAERLGPEESASWAYLKSLDARWYVGRRRNLWNRGDGAAIPAASASTCVHSSVCESILSYWKLHISSIQLTRKKRKPPCPARVTNVQPVAAPSQVQCMGCCWELTPLARLPRKTMATLATPIFPLLTREHILACQFSSWYPIFAKRSLKSTIIRPLDLKFQEYLHADGVFVPEGSDDRFTLFGSCSHIWWTEATKSLGRKTRCRVMAPRKEKTNRTPLLYHHSGTHSPNWMPKYGRL